MSKNLLFIGGPAARTFRTIGNDLDLVDIPNFDETTQSYGEFFNFTTYQRRLIDDGESRIDVFVAIGTNAIQDLLAVYSRKSVR